MGKERNKNWRIVFNNDGGGDVFKHPKPISLPQLTDVIDPLADSGVDTFVFCMFSGNLFLHDTSIGEIYSHGKVSKKAIDLINRGMDPMRILCERAHELNISFIVSLRMNDLHDLFFPEAKLICKMKREHPDMLIGDKGKPYKRTKRPYPYRHHDVKSLSSMAWNYADPRVIQMRHKILEETLGRYDIDGLELDFLRHPIFFPPGEEGEYAHIMTGFVREVRKMLETAGKQRNKRMEFGAIVPYSPEVCEEIGVQIHRWLKEGLLDYIVPRAMDVTTTEIPYDQWRSIVSALPTQIFGAPLETGDTRLNDDVFAGFASLYKQAKLNGIYLFNFNYRPHPLPENARRLLKGLANPSLLDTHDKIYLLAHHGDKFGTYVDRFQMPCILRKERQLEFFLGEEFNHDKGRLLKEVSIYILTEEYYPKEDKVGFIVNGKLVPASNIRTYKEDIYLPKLGGWWWREPESMMVIDICATDLPLCPGKNKIAIKLKERWVGAKEALKVRDLIVLVSSHRKVKKLNEILRG